jgi:adenine/guanine phosphoribosyltransferase-like PRPP-binding protein
MKNQTEKGGKGTKKLKQHKRRIKRKKKLPVIDQLTNNGKATHYLVAF